MAGYKITSNNVKKNSILKVEGICPICQHYPNKYNEIIKREKKGAITRQFSFCCTNCDSTWDGNIYNDDFSMHIDSKKKIFRKRFNNVKLVF